jgi:hypothetical protein
MESSCSIVWKTPSENDDNYKDILEQSFELYKQRPLETPIDTSKKLSSYYPCNFIVLCNLTDTTILGGIMWWQNDYGNKISTSFSKDPEIYKNYIIKKYYELLQTPGYYAELSDALEYLLIQKGLNNIKDIDTIKAITKVDDSDIFTENDPRREEYKLGKTPSPSGSYLRKIEGIGLHRKALYGKPCISKTFNGTGCNKTCVMNGGFKNKLKKNKLKKKSNKNKLKKKSKTIKILKV